MKIIAKSGPNRFLAQLTTTEIDLLAGKKIGEGSGGYYRNEDREIPSGTTFNITEAFQQIHRNDIRKDEIERVRQTLSGVLSGLEMIKPLLEEPQREYEPIEQKAQI